ATSPVTAFVAPICTRAIGFVPSDMVFDSPVTGDPSSDTSTVEEPPATTTWRVTSCHALKPRIVVLTTSIAATWFLTRSLPALLTFNETIPVPVPVRTRSSVSRLPAEITSTCADRVTSVRGSKVADAYPAASEVVARPAHEPVKTSPCWTIRPLEVVQAARI